MLKNASMKLPDARNALSVSRRGTARLHAALECHPLFARLASTDCTAADYARAVRCLGAIYARIDRLFLMAEPYRPAAIVPFRPRAPRLYAECAAAGLEAGFREKGSLPEVAGVGAYLGARYVVDGAQFGHRQIAGSLAHSPVSAVLDRPQSFWRTDFVYPDEWRTVCQLMADLTNRREIAAAALTARALFWYFHQHVESAILDGAEQCRVR